LMLNWRMPAASAEQQAVSTTAAQSLKRGSMIGVNI